MQGSKQKDWAEALRRAVHRESAGKGSAKWLDVIANRVVEAAAEGDAQAFKEIGDRLDGKPKQQTEVSGPDGDALPLSISIGFKSAD